ncbi:MAG: hypothetical protein LBJ96_06095 [Holosporaceae bacterium]|nr:hypothetical protein [Holosporaceae bacterium]
MDVGGNNVNRPLNSGGRSRAFTPQTVREIEESNRRVLLCGYYFGTVEHALQGYKHEILVEAAKRIARAFPSEVQAPDHLEKKRRAPIICWFVNNAPSVDLGFVATMLSGVYGESNGVNETDAAASTRLNFTRKSLQDAFSGQWYNAPPISPVSAFAQPSAPAPDPAQVFSIANLLNH